MRAAVSQANAVGDLDGLMQRLDALAPVIAEHRAERKAERSRQTQEAREAKERFVVEAESSPPGTIGEAA